MRRGEVRWVRFARPDKRRPVLILTRDSVIGVLGEATVAPLTRIIRDIPSEVVLTSEDGLPETCAVNYDPLQTVSPARRGDLITTLRGPRLAEVARAARFALDL